MTNIAAARELVARVRALGVTDFCVCAGSRNSPLLAVLGTSDVRVFSFFDERAAAFFAVGRMKLQERPCAVVTTSGTAVAELLPATIESYYSGLPLILITADRPARYRGTGAPQSIEQVGIFGPYAEVDPEAWRGDGPLHWNVEFDEPLIDEALIDKAAIAEPVMDKAVIAENCHPERSEGPVREGGARTHRSLHHPPAQVPRYARDDRVQPATARPLVLIGGLAARDRDRVREFALALGAPVYAEPLSGLREDPALEAIRIRNERMLGRGGFTSVIRVGNVPTLRFWRDLDEKLRDLPLVSYSALPFTGLSRGSLHSIEELPSEVERVDRVEHHESFFAADREAAAWHEQLLDDEPQSELTMLRDFARRIERGARVYVGNSLPIREWDLVAPRDDRGFTLEANRGANGIDGQLSTFFGQCDPARMNVAIVGDLTALYDSNAPWIAPQLDPGIRFRIAILNNGGGRIFSRVASLRPLGAEFREQVIENAHGVRFGDWARMWNIVELVNELRPDAEATARVWTRYDELWR